jgi:hypothetical protein
MGHPRHCRLEVVGARDHVQGDDTLTHDFAVAVDIHDERVQGSRALP